MKATPLIILTRPIGASSRLSTLLSPLGFQVLACPTLDIKTLPATTGDLACLSDIDLIFFVSGAAVRAFDEQLLALGLSLPSRIQIAAVGQSTALEILRVWGQTDVLHPEEGATEDSEGLWKVLVARGRWPRHVLIVRGQSGRDWLADQLRRQGTKVSFHAAYCRTQATWDAHLVSRLQACAAADQLPVFVCASEQGILALVRLVKQHGLHAWCRGGRFVVTHNRHRHVLADQFLFSDAEKNGQIFLSGMRDDAILSTVATVSKSISCNEWRHDARIMPVKTTIRS